MVIPYSKVQMVLHKMSYSFRRDVLLMGHCECTTAILVCRKYFASWLILYWQRLLCKKKPYKSNFYNKNTLINDYWAVVYTWAVHWYWQILTMSGNKCLLSHILLKICSSVVIFSGVFLISLKKFVMRPFNSSVGRPLEAAKHETRQAFLSTNFIPLGHNFII